MYGSQQRGLAAKRFNAVYALPVVLARMTRSAAVCYANGSLETSQEWTANTHPACVRFG